MIGTKTAGADMQGADTDDVVTYSKKKKNQLKTKKQHLKTKNNKTVFY